MENISLTLVAPHLFRLSNGAETVIDSADLPSMAGRSWFAVRRKGQVYAASWVNGKQVLLHRFLLGVHEVSRPYVDHIDGNGLNNLRKNLRLATPAQNARNRAKSSYGSSRFKGVSFSRRTRKWKSTIRTGNRWFHLGLFKSPRAAAVAYNRVARRLFGDFAKLNDVTK